MIIMIKISKVSSRQNIIHIIYLSTTWQRVDFMHICLDGIDKTEFHLHIVLFWSAGYHPTSCIWGIILEMSMHLGLITE